MSDLLERAARAMIERPPLDGPSAAQIGQRLATRRHRRVGVVSALLLIAAVAGLVAISRRQPNSAGSQGAGDGKLHCDDWGCHGLDRLPVLDGAADYFAGGVSLGTPTVEPRLFDQTLRCVTLSADGHSCVKVEGMAGVAAVTYAASTATTIDTTDRSLGTFQVEVGTTFADITPGEYAATWGRAADAAPATVRGHAAVA